MQIDPDNIPIHKEWYDEYFSRKYPRFVQQLRDRGLSRSQILNRYIEKNPSALYEFLNMIKIPARPQGRKPKIPTTGKRNVISFELSARLKQAVLDEANSRNKSLKAVVNEILAKNYGMEDEIP